MRRGGGSGGSSHRAIEGIKEFFFFWAARIRCGLVELLGQRSIILLVFLIRSGLIIWAECSKSLVFGHGEPIQLGPKRFYFELDVQLLQSGGLELEKCAILLKVVVQN